jgi:hypothetical protein
MLAIVSGAVPGHTGAYLAVVIDFIPQRPGPSPSGPTLVTSLQDI